MLYQISSDNMDLTEDMQILAKEKMAKLERFFAHLSEDEATTRIVLNEDAQNGTFQVKVDLVVRGRNYFSQEKEYSLETGLIRTVEEIERQLEKDRDENERDWKKQRKMKSAEGIKDYVGKI